ncbi:MAG: hypothetical protein SOZ53_01370 [Candidatus Onthovivens sp.]|nr:hypothetical protein [Candidatus Onthovivens sp.]
MVEKNEIAKKIEDLMGFEFEKLELIGHVTDKIGLYSEGVFYKYFDKVFCFRIEDSKICSISSIEDLSLTSVSFLSKIKVKDKMYSFKSNKILFINPRNFGYEYALFNYGNYNYDKNDQLRFISKMCLQLKEEELVTLKLCGEFFNYYLLDPEKSV